MNVLIIKWANVDFLYEEILRKTVDNVDIYHIRHNADRFNRGSSLLKDILHLGKQFISVLSTVNKYDRVIIFGTNIARFLPFFIRKEKLALIVYNEINEAKFLLEILDKLVFNFYWKKIAFSSTERANLYSNKYNKPFDKVVLNLPLINYHQVIGSSIKKKEVVYCGVINKQRFNNEALTKIKESSYKFNFIGKKVNVEISNQENISYIGEFSHAETNKLQEDFVFALLSYPIDSINNNYCAPIKIYEYINNGCVCVSVYKNKGLEIYIKEYPQLFISLEDLPSYNYNQELYFKQRTEFLTRSIKCLEKLILGVI